MNKKFSSVNKWYMRLLTEAHAEIGSFLESYKHINWLTNAFDKPPTASNILFNINLGGTKIWKFGQNFIMNISTKRSTQSMNNPKYIQTQTDITCSLMQIHYLRKSKDPQNILHRNRTFLLQ